ncbi:MAG: hypothetical protein JRJ02_07865 [Deltaproteobacteria bacterium]|nr:hypothetical protein [Deltaproteobacteria bacterium]
MNSFFSVMLVTVIATPLIFQEYLAITAKLIRFSVHISYGAAVAHLEKNLLLTRKPIPRYQNQEERNGNTSQS